MRSEEFKFGGKDNKKARFYGGLFEFFQRSSSDFDVFAVGVLKVVLKHVEVFDGFYFE